MKFTGPYFIEYEPTEDVDAGIQRSLAYLQKLAIDKVERSPN